VITDITERKRDEDAIRQARDAAEGASRAKSHFLAKMSHEIRTPLNGVLGAAHVLLGTLLNDEQRRHAQTIIDSGEALLWVLNDILDLSKIEAGKLNLVAVPFDLHRQVEVVVQTFATQAQMRRLELITRIGPEVPQHVAGDPLRLRQVLSNLLGNAIKFTPAGGVHVLLESTRRGERDALVRFAVIDTGIGVAHEAQSRIFEPFVQAEDTITRQYGGTGLGLAIAKQLVEMMGGEIGMASEPGRGATFWFTLPLVLVEPSQTADAGASLSAAAIEPIRAKVLLVEDNPINVEVMKAMLEQLGCSVATAHNGREALRQLAEHTFDVVLMDCEMPVMDGYAATAAIRERERESGGHQPIIALTAHVLEGDREACVARGMDDFLAKPFRPEELRAMIRKHLSGTPPQPGLPATTPSPTRLSEDEQSKIVFEPRAFDHIVQAGGDEGRAVLARVLDLFRHQMPERVAALHRAAETADLATAAFIAHSAGSSAQLLGGGKLTALCRAIEAAARAQELASVWALAARLPAELQALLAALDAQAPPPIAPVSAAPTARAYRSVLVVDDAEDHRLLAAHALRKVGFEVHLAKDGEDALQIAGRIRPDLVLMDARLPGIDGYTACERLLALPECRGARVVMVTGAVFPDSVERARAVGAIAVLPKMWDWGEFVQAIEALVEPSVKAVH
jgi:CheY-like chemotaxis protein/nitrogen-specific signal transduction histidine kinase